VVEDSIVFDDDIPVPMRDGTIIRADLYRPDAVTLLCRL
jgi:predicted acyl esterase